MKKHQTPNRRALLALIPAAAMLAGPALAQEVQTAPPPVLAAPPPTQAVSPPRIVQTVPDAAPAPVAEAPAADTTTVATPRAVRRAPQAAARPRVSPRVSTPAPVAAAPVETPAPVAAPVVAPEPAAPPAAVNPVPQIDTPIETTSTTASTTPTWPLIAGGILLLAALAAFLLLRRRRVDDDEYYEEAYVEQPMYESEPVVAPVVLEREPQFLQPATQFAAAPAIVGAAEHEQTASEDAALAKADVDDVAELTTADAPVANRPWLEFAMRPIRAGTNVDEALVEIELTIGNSGSIAAKDVRVSTFMFASEPGGQADMERMLLERGDDNSVPPVTIAPGEGTRVDATLALPRADLGVGNGDSFSPVVVADARYTLPDGSEGRTSASFRIGVSDAGGAAMMPFPIDTRAMRDDVEAELYGVPEHA